jgi:hypothetical protein
MNATVVDDSYVWPSTGEGGGYIWTSSDGGLTWEATIWDLLPGDYKGSDTEWRNDELRMELVTAGPGKINLALEIYIEGYMPAGTYTSYRLEGEEYTLKADDFDPLGGKVYAQLAKLELVHLVKLEVPFEAISEYNSTTELTRMVYDAAAGVVKVTGTTYLTNPTVSVKRIRETDFTVTLAGPKTVGKRSWGMPLKQWKAVGMSSDGGVTVALAPMESPWSTRRSGHSFANLDCDWLLTVPPTPAPTEAPTGAPTKRVAPITDMLIELGCTLVSMATLDSDLPRILGLRWLTFDETVPLSGEGSALALLTVNVWKEGQSFPKG